MTKPAPTRLDKAKTKPKTLAQQQTDFTSEGSPPPGKVSTEAPVTEDKAAKVVLRPVPNVPGARKGPPQRFGR